LYLNLIFLLVGEITRQSFHRPVLRKQNPTLPKKNKTKTPQTLEDFLMVLIFLSGCVHPNLEMDA
jgi:hypothetical protein